MPPTPKILVCWQYDWRLSPLKLSERDAFFAHIKSEIEQAVDANNMPAILIGHSLGNMVVHQFFHWLQATIPDTFVGWSAKHVVSFYSLGACGLGCSGALRLLLTMVRLAGDHARRTAAAGGLIGGVRFLGGRYHGATHLRGCVLQRRPGGRRAHGQQLTPAEVLGMDCPHQRKPGAWAPRLVLANGCYPARQSLTAPNGEKCIHGEADAGHGSGSRKE